MPTGYTSAIADGITFEQFAMDCARAFGACISLRDESGGGERIPERFEPSDYHATQLEQIRQEIADLEALQLDECERRALAEHEADEAQRKKALQGKISLRTKYEAMLAAVNAWVPPSLDHVEMQNFMRSQITESINFDCDTTYYDKPSVRLSGADWLLSRLTKLRGSVDYHETQHAKEVERTNNRNEWIRLLRESLTPTE